MIQRFALEEKRFVIHLKTINTFSFSTFICCIFHCLNNKQTKIQFDSKRKKIQSSRKIHQYIEINYVHTQKSIRLHRKGNFIYELVSYGDEKRSEDCKKQINKTVLYCGIYCPLLCLYYVTENRWQINSFKQCSLFEIHRNSHVQHWLQILYINNFVLLWKHFSSEFYMIWVVIVMPEGVLRIALLFVQPIVFLFYLIK